MKDISSLILPPGVKHTSASDNAPGGPMPISVDKAMDQRVVVVMFGRTVNYFALPPDDADVLADEIKRQAEAVRMGYN